MRLFLAKEKLRSVFDVRHLPILHVRRHCRSIWPKGLHLQHTYITGHDQPISTKDLTMRFDRIDFNRRILQLNGNLMIYPWKFLSSGSFAVARKGMIPLILFYIQLALHGLYILYIQYTLLRTVVHGVDTRRYEVFGVLLMRCIAATTFAYLGYEIFVAHAGGHELLYNFVQLSPGKTHILQRIPT